MGLGPATAEPVGEAALDHLVDDLLNGWGAQLLLGLTPELRLGEHHLERRDQTLLNVILGGPVLVLPSQLGQLPGVLEEDIVDGPGECPIEARRVRAAVAGWDGVHERLDPGVVALNPPEGDLDGAFPIDVAHLPVDRDPFGEL